MPSLNQIPFMRAKDTGGMGVSAQRIGKFNRDSRPHVGSGAYGPGGQGVAAQRINLPKQGYKTLQNPTGALSAPFPYFGGKSRVASQIWAKLGNPTVYVEPFAGSLACLLARPDGAGQREIVCDLDGGISNFWRAVTADPDAVAAWADYPTFHADLTARHKWLRAWFAEHTAELSNDPHFYCAKAAGWWVWGISLWIGGGWCNAISDTKDRDQIPHAGTGGGGFGGQGVSEQRKTRPFADAQRVWDVRPAVTSACGVSAQAQRAKDPSDKRPLVSGHPGGKGVSAQGTRAQKDRDQIPFVDNKGGGQGVNAQRAQIPQVPDQRPLVDNKGYGNAVSAQSSRATPDQVPHMANWNGGRGVSAQRLTVPDQIPQVYDRPGGKGTSEQRTTRPDLVSWFRAIQERLKGVIVLNRSWESALTPTLLMHTPTSPKPPVGILLDPPYLTVDRQSELYGSDADGSSSDVATAAYAWAIANGNRFRIAYCCHEGDFPVPEGWTFITASFGGVKDVERRASRQDMVMFSPMCVPDAPDPQMTLL